jgi:hypothetical protein
MPDHDGYWNLGDLYAVKNTLTTLARRLAERPVVHLWNPRQRIEFDLPGGVWMIDHGVTNYRIRCRACTQQPALRYEFLVEGEDSQLYGPIGSTCLFVHTLGADEAFRLGKSIIDAFETAEKQHRELHGRVMRACAHPEEYLANFGLKWAARFVRDETHQMNTRLVHAVWNVLGPRIPLSRHAYHGLLALQRQLDIWDARPAGPFRPASSGVSGSVARSRHTVLRSATVSGTQRTERQINTGILDRLRDAARERLHEVAAPSPPHRGSRQYGPEAGYSTARRPPAPLLVTTPTRRPAKEMALQRKTHKSSREAASKDTHRTAKATRPQVARQRTTAPAGLTHLCSLQGQGQKRPRPNPLPAVPPEQQPVVLINTHVDPWQFYLASMGLPPTCPRLPSSGDKFFKLRIERHYQQHRKLDPSDVQLLRALLKG